MAERGSRRIAAGLLSMLLPGAGQVYAGARRRGLVLLCVTAAVLMGLAALAAAEPLALAESALSRRALVVILLANAALLAFRLFAVADAWRLGREAVSRAAVAALAVIAVATAMPHVAAGYVAVRGYDVLESVFAEEEPDDVLPARGLFIVASEPQPPTFDALNGGLEPKTRPRLQPTPFRGEQVPLPGTRHVFLASEQSLRKPWVTILLLGTDRGPGNVGERTDTMIVAAIQRGTGRAVAFGVPRNFADVPLGGVAAKTMKRYPEMLNGLYSFARTRPELFPGGSDPGATALKQTISRLLGIRIDYYALVDLLGFADMVDALGGVRVHVKERLVDEVTRPAWGEPKPRIDVVPGRTYHFYGREALAYVRSRKTSNDYTRMARQRCFLSALADQLDVVDILRHFGLFASTAERSVRTDIPLRRVPDLARLAAGMEPDLTLTQTFGPQFIARRRPADNVPVPAVERIRATVRELILHGRPANGAVADTAQQSC
jgi:LCP family protein required for cell wall assembly